MLSAKQCLIWRFCANVNQGIARIDGLCKYAWTMDMPNLAKGFTKLGGFQTRMFKNMQINRAIGVFCWESPLCCYVCCSHHFGLISNLKSLPTKSPCIFPLVKI